MWSQEVETIDTLLQQEKEQRHEEKQGDQQTNSKRTSLTFKHFRWPLKFSLRRSHDVEDRGCTPAPSSTRSHISVEGWTESYVAEWAEVQRDLPHTAPRNLGKMGFLDDQLVGLSWLASILR